MLHIAILSLAIVTADTDPPARIDLLPRPATTPALADDYSDAYHTRQTIHRIGGDTMLPLFAAEYDLADRLLNRTDNAE